MQTQIEPDCSNSLYAVELNDTLAASYRGHHVDICLTHCVQVKDVHKCQQGSQAA